ncbi:MAG: peptidoglycan-binding protein [candidate division Zixibacteria bacterium]|nr:peptidoglycan-binding protein [candidate division Zixibacteria bacterium]
MTQIQTNGSRGKPTAHLQSLLNKRGFNLEVDGVFGDKTGDAVRAFQAQNLGPNEQPLSIDGIVGPLTWWSLSVEYFDNNYAQDARLLTLPDQPRGVINVGLLALEVAASEIKSGACEVGGNNRGPWVRKYLNNMAPEGSPWCGAFISWIFSQTPTGIPFRYSLSARDILNQFRKHGWAYQPGADFAPLVGDLVFWWRIRADSWQGHAGIVSGFANGILYSIEGNKGPKIAEFEYVYSRMEKILAFGRAPNI